MHEVVRVIPIILICRLCKSRSFRNMSDTLRNEVVIDNSGHGPLRVPDFGGLPVEHELNCEDRFTHGIRDW
jgi:hypothetical protein